MLEKAIIISLIVQFLYEITHEGMILQVVDKVIFKVNPYLKKPLYDCPVCMSIWWGSPICCFCMLYCNWEFENWQQIIFTSILAGGINVIFSHLKFF